MSGKVIRSNWRWPRIDLLDPPRKLLYLALLQELPSDIHTDASKRNPCERALISVLLHPDCPDFSGFNQALKGELLREISRMHFSSNRVEMRRTMIEMMAAQTGFDPRVLETVKSLYEDPVLAQAMDRLLAGLSLARIIIINE